MKVLLKGNFAVEIKGSKICIHTHVAHIRSVKAQTYLTYQIPFEIEYFDAAVQAETG